MTQKETAKAKHMASEIVKNYFKDMKIKTFSTSSFALCCVYDKDFENDWKELLQQMGQAVKNEKKAVCFHKNLDTILEKIYVQIQGNKRGSIYKDYCAVQTKHIDVNLSTG